MLSLFLMCVLTYSEKTTSDTSTTSPELAELITKIEAAENIYANHDVHYHSVFQDADWIVNNAKSAANGNNIAAMKQYRSDTKIHSVVQKNCFLMDQESISFTFAKNYTTGSYSVFDGTRQLNWGKSASKAWQSEQRKESEYRFFPHSWMIRNNQINGPLSVILQGPKSLYDSPFKEIVKSMEKMEYVVRLDAAETAGDLECEKIEIVKKENRRETNRYVVWLAKDRNYFPVKMEQYGSKKKSAPLLTGEVHEWKEIQPNIWFPMKVEMTAYGLFTVQKSSRRMKVWTETYEIDQIELDPQLPDNYFSEIDLPEGTEIIRNDLDADSNNKKPSTRSKKNR